MVLCSFISLLLVIDGIKYISVGSSSDVIVSVLFDSENVSFDANLVMYINRTNILPTMIMNRKYENQNFFILFLLLVILLLFGSVVLFLWLVGVLFV